MYEDDTARAKARFLASILEPGDDDASYVAKWRYVEGVYRSNPRTEAGHVQFLLSRIRAAQGRERERTDMIREYVGGDSCLGGILAYLERRAVVLPPVEGPGLAGQMAPKVYTLAAGSEQAHLTELLQRVTTASQGEHWSEDTPGDLLVYMQRRLGQLPPARKPRRVPANVEARNLMLHFEGMDDPQYFTF